MENKSTLIVPIGISGSGKSTLFNKIKTLYPEVKKVCMDDIRKEFSGNVSDQSFNKKVFDIRTYRIRNLLKNNETVYVDCTNLTDINDWYKMFKFDELKVIILTDSFDADLCYSRVRHDIELGIDRADVPRYVIKRQHERFLNVVNKIDNYSNVIDYKNYTFDFNNEETRKYKSLIV